jgi:hypothetical protein
MCRQAWEGARQKNGDGAEGVAQVGESDDARSARLFFAPAVAQMEAHTWSDYFILYFSNLSLCFTSHGLCSFWIVMQMLHR